MLFKFLSKQVLLYAYIIPEAGHQAEELRDLSGDVGPADGEVLEVGELGEGGRDGASEALVLDEDEVLEVREVADLGRDLGGGEAAGDDEGVDAVGLAVAGDAVPLAAVGVWVPRGEDVRVVEGSLELEEGFLVVWVAEIGESGGE